MKRSLAAGIALALAVSSITPAMAQDKKADGVKKSDELKTAAGAKSMEARTVEGTVKSAQADGIVISGKDQADVSSKEPGKDRQWAFAVNDKTTIKRGQTAVVATDLKAGDKVTVSYTEHDGKVIAQSVTVRDGETGKTPASAREVPASKK